MTIIKETKYLLFRSSQSKGRKTKHIAVINKSSNEEIATIDWYRQWRQYCFMPEPFFRTVWNNTCITDVLSVINQLMQERKINKPEGE